MAAAAEPSESGKCASDAVSNVAAWASTLDGRDISVAIEADLGSTLVIRLSKTSVESSMMLELVHGGVDFPHIRAATVPELQSLMHTFAYKCPRTPVELLQHALPLVDSALHSISESEQASAGGSDAEEEAQSDREDDEEEDDPYGTDDDDDMYGPDSAAAGPVPLSGSHSAGGGTSLSLQGSSSVDATFESSAISRALAAVIAMRESHHAKPAAASASSSASASLGESLSNDIRGHWTSARRAGMYQIFTTEELCVAASELCRAMARRFDIGSADARALLHHCQWDLGRTEALLSDADRRETVAEEAGMELYCPERPAFPEGGTECAICYDDVEEESQGHALECGHWFCLDCWQAHCHASIGSGIAVMRCKCPDEDCKRLVDDSTLLRFSDERDKQILRTIIAKSVDSGALAQQCPRSECGRHSVFGTPTVLNVFCDCSECFCFRCGQRGHGPCPCELAVVFENKEAWSKDPENGRLDKSLAGKIKPCPKCGIRTEKVDGCQYISCTHCRTPWCWMCGQFGPKVHHVYECNDAPVDSWAKKTADTAFAADGRFDWHMERFDNHMGSLQFATKRRKECAATRDRLLERGKTPAQADLVIEAADLLVECRHVCAWTYAFAYFIADKGSRAMLAFVQKDLESYTEQLSAKVERKDIDDLVSDEQDIRALVAALTTFKDAMEAWTPPPGAKISTIEEIEAALKEDKERVQKFNSSAGAKKRVKRTK